MPDCVCFGFCCRLFGRERGREIQLLRVVGAPPYFLFLLIELEALLITLLSLVLGAGLLTVVLAILEDYFMSLFGHVEMNLFTENSLDLIIAMISASIIVAAIPSFSGYLQSRNLSRMK